MDQFQCTECAQIDKFNFFFSVFLSPFFSRLSLSLSIPLSLSLSHKQNARHAVDRCCADIISWYSYTLTFKSLLLLRRHDLLLFINNLATSSLLYSVTIIVFDSFCILGDAYECAVLCFDVEQKSPLYIEAWTCWCWIYSIKHQTHLST